MKIKFFFKYLIAIIFLVVLVSTVFLIIKYTTNKVPVEEITNARKTLGQVKMQLAGDFENDDFKKAENFYLKAMEDWQLQNQKFFPFRDYTQTREFAMRSVDAALKAGKEARALKEKLTRSIETDLNETWEYIEYFERNYKNLPLGGTIHDRFSRGKMKYFEAQQFYENGEIKIAMATISEALELLVKANRDATFVLEDFFGGFSDWEKNHKLAFSMSKRGQVVVLVNKMEATCSVLRSGKVMEIFQAEFGRNWMGDKIKSGDNATPEGVYKITEKKQGAKTGFYKALLLDYPNKADKARYERLQKEGVLSENDQIGGLIEIHGEGNKGINWTNGCVALANNDMDVVFNYCKVNTPVVIIGAIKTLNEYLE